MSAIQTIGISIAAVVYLKYDLLIKNNNHILNIPAGHPILLNNNTNIVLETPNCKLLENLPKFNSLENATKFLKYNKIIIV
jgi:hypothetical protein